MNILTRLMRLRRGDIIHRDANNPAVWEKAVALAKLMPHLKITEFIITPMHSHKKTNLVVSNPQDQITLPVAGRYTLRDIWNHQSEPRPEFFAFASHFGFFSKRNPHLVTKKRSKTGVTWVIL